MSAQTKSVTESKQKQGTKRSSKEIITTSLSGNNNNDKSIVPAKKRRRTTNQSGKYSNNNNAQEDNQEEKINDSNANEFIKTIENNRIKTCNSSLHFDFDETRIRNACGGTHGGLNDDNFDINGIVYWMSRDQRIQDNWSLIYAQKIALTYHKPLHIVFCLLPKFLDATIRHFDFMLRGLEEIEQECRNLQIPFHLLLGDCTKILPKFLNENNINIVISDFSPLKISQLWTKKIGKIFYENKPNKIHFVQIDSHNIVPLWITSDKQEYAARTIRNKINSKLNHYLTEFPPIIKHQFNITTNNNNNNKTKTKTKSKSNDNSNNINFDLLYPKVDWKAARASLEVDMTVKPVKWAKPGPKAGYNELLSFINLRLKNYSLNRNDPNKLALSNLSPWFHFGHLSTQRAALEVSKYRSKYNESVAAFLEESIVRRELSDNFCFFNPNYDSVKGAHSWAKQTLKLHTNDKREYIYTLSQLENSETHDDLWNASQNQMVNYGKMHGFLRMYWAKKILEWTETPEQALKYAIYLNDKYELDGRDPNGYVGCMWSICGIHDQGWRERNVFGKIRYMNYKGCQRKFDVEKFVNKWNGDKNIQSSQKQNDSKNTTNTSK